MFWRAKRDFSDAKRRSDRRSRERSTCLACFSEIEKGNMEARLKPCFSYESKAKKTIHADAEFERITYDTRQMTYKPSLS